MDPQEFLANAPGSLVFTNEGIWAYRPYALPPLFRWTDRLVSALSKADWAVARLREKLLVQYSLVSVRALLARIEASYSCQLAGLPLNLDQLFKFEAGYRSPTVMNADTPEVAVLKYARTLERACGHAERHGFSLKEIEGLQKSIWSGKEDIRWPIGEFRREQTWIGPPGASPGQADYVPPPPADMFQALESLAGFMEGPQAAPPLIRLAMIHYQFEVIHPFFDANGRTGRLLIPILMCAWKMVPGPCVPISRYFSKHEEQYRQLLADVCRENAWEDWFVFFLEGVNQAAQFAMDLLSELSKTRETLNARIAGDRNAARLRNIIELFFGRPLLNVNQVRTALPEGNFKSAARCINRLTDAGVVSEQTGQVRHRIFQADRVLEPIRKLTGS